MIKRGRKSTADLTVIAFGGRRPDADPGLTDDEAAIWRETVATEAVEVFATAAARALLADYCRHRAAADKVSRIINQFQTDWLKAGDGAKRFQSLLAIRAAETRGSAEKAAKLRLTNQSRYTPQAAATAGRATAIGPRPWEL